MMASAVSRLLRSSAVSSASTRPGPALRRTARKAMAAATAGAQTHGNEKRRSPVRRKRNCAAVGNGHHQGGHHEKARQQEESDLPVRLAELAGVCPPHRSDRLGRPASGLRKTRKLEREDLVHVNESLSIMGSLAVRGQCTHTLGWRQ